MDWSIWVRLYIGDYHVTGYTRLSCQFFADAASCIPCVSVCYFSYTAELPVDKLVECHGHFRSASCTQCGKPAPDMQVIQNIILKKSQVPRCTYCKTGKIKPDIVFFGEGLPMRFHDLLPRDLKQADCCLVLGTSLQVAPVSNIPEQVPTRCRRMLLNRELVGPFSSRSSKRPHDLHHLGDCDDSIRSLAHALGWRDELEEMHQKLGSSSPK